MKTIEIPADLWDEILDFIEDQVDVRDGGDGTPLPNTAMYLTTRIEHEVRAPVPRKLLGFAAAVRNYGDNWIHAGFPWNGESYRGMSPATLIAMQDSRGPDDNESHAFKCLRRWGRGWYSAS